MIRRFIKKGLRPKTPYLTFKTSKEQENFSIKKQCLFELRNLFFWLNLTFLYQCKNYAPYRNCVSRISTDEVLVAL